MTFHQPKLAAVMRDKVVEARLHMDYPDRIDPEKFPEHVFVRDELIGQSGAPNYAILDPASGEFLYRIRGVPGGDYGKLHNTFLDIFRSLPAKKS